MQFIGSVNHIFQVISSPQRMSPLMLSKTFVSPELLELLVVVIVMPLVPVIPVKPWSECPEEYLELLVVVFVMVCSPLPVRSPKSKTSIPPPCTLEGVCARLEYPDSLL